MNGKAFASLARLTENARIVVIAKTAAAGAIVGFVVEDDAKADRYLQKLAAFPVRVVDRGPGPVKDTVMVSVGPKEG